MGLFKMADFMTFLYADGIVPGEKKKWIIHWKEGNSRSKSLSRLEGSPSRGADLRDNADVSIVIEKAEYRGITASKLEDLLMK